MARGVVTKGRVAKRNPTPRAGANAVPIEQFGKDHWSLLLYLETTVVDETGVPDRRRMRSDGDKYPTKLASGLFQPGHNDWDCLNDLETAGYIVNTGTGMQPVVELTDIGWTRSHQLRRRLADDRTIRNTIVRTMVTREDEAFRNQRNETS